MAYAKPQEGQEPEPDSELAKALLADADQEGALPLIGGGENRDLTAQFPSSSAAIIREGAGAFASTSIIAKRLLSKLP